MKALLLGAENEVGMAIQVVAASRMIDCVPVESRRVDLGSARRIGRLMRRHRPDIVINAVDYLPRADDDGARRLLQHIVRDGAHNVAKAAHGRDTPLIHLSSDSVFLGSGGGVCTEQDPPSPADDYGRAHLEAETRILEDVPASLILRSGWVFSGHEDGRLTGLISLLQGEQPVAAELDAQFAPTAAGDLGRVVVAIIQQVSCGIQPWGIYHYCAADIVSWERFLIALSVAGCTARVSNIAPVADSVDPVLPPFALRARVQLNCQKLLHHFGIRQRSWDESLTEVLKSLGHEGAVAMAQAGIVPKEQTSTGVTPGEGELT